MSFQDLLGDLFCHVNGILTTDVNYSADRIRWENKRAEVTTTKKKIIKYRNKTNSKTLMYLGDETFRDGVMLPFYTDSRVPI